MPPTHISRFAPLGQRLFRLRALLSFFVVAAAQFLCPSAAADPASKIDPPAWSYRHSQAEIQAYGARATTQEPQTKQRSSIRETKLRRILRTQRPIEANLEKCRRS